MSNTSKSNVLLSYPDWSTRGGLSFIPSFLAAASLPALASSSPAWGSIRVNAIAPGTTMTEMIQRWVDAEPNILQTLKARTPLGRAAQPHEIAEAAAWLLSDRASYVTGVVMRVDGGMRA